MADLGGLALAVQEGKPGATLALWEAVRYFVTGKALEYSRRSRVPFDDLMQDGFLAVLSAVAKFEPEKGFAFLIVLSFCLKTEFSKEAGTRSTKRDLLQYTESADAPRYKDAPDGPTVTESTPDPEADLALLGVDYADFLNYCRRLIHAALGALPDNWAGVLRCHYLEGLTLEETAQRLGYSGKEAAGYAKGCALRFLRRCSRRRELFECLEIFEDFHCYEEAARSTKAGSFQRTGISSTEAAAIGHYAAALPLQS